MGPGMMEATPTCLPQSVSFTRNPGIDTRNSHCRHCCRYRLLLFLPQLLPGKWVKLHIFPFYRNLLNNKFLLEFLFNCFYCWARAPVTGHHDPFFHYKRCRRVPASHLSVPGGFLLCYLCPTNKSFGIRNSTLKTRTGVT